MSLVVSVKGWLRGEFLEGDGEEHILVTLILPKAGAEEAEECSEQNAE
jgi:hypothetical protein